MPLQKQSIGIPLGGGVQEGTGAKLLDPPALLDLRDARWDKRGEYAKRFGADSVANTGLNTGDPNVLVDHDGALLQYSAQGSAVWAEGQGRWVNDQASPRAARVITDSLVTDNGSYRDTDIAYEPTSGLVCVVSRDDTFDRVIATFVDAESGAIVRTPVALPEELQRQPRVLAFGGRFLVTAIGQGSTVGSVVGDTIWGASYNTSENDYTFGDAVEIGGITGTALRCYDAHVADSSQTHAHVAWGNTATWKCLQVTNTGTVDASVDNVASASAHAIAVLHDPDRGLVYVLHDDFAAVPNQLAIGVFSDRYDAAPSRKVVLEYSTTATGDGRRCTIARGSSGHIWCFASHSTCDGGAVGGIEFRNVGPAGSPIAPAGFAPGLILASKASADNFGRVVFAAAREIGFSPATGFSGKREPLPCAFLLTPYYTSNLVASIATLGRFGHDSYASPADQEATYLGSIARVGDEHWAPYTVLLTRNDGAQTSGLGPSRLPKYGWRWGVRLMRATLEPAPVRVSSAEGLSLLAGGVLAAHDGQRTTELAVPIVPHAPLAANTLSSFCVDAEGTPYDFLSMSSIPNDGTGQGDGQVLLATCQYKIVLRWIDAAGNIRRSSASEAFERTILADYNIGAVVAFDGTDLYFNFNSETEEWEPDTSRQTRLLVIPKPSPTALANDPDTKIQAEIYRTEFTYTMYDCFSGSDDDVVLGTLEGDGDFRLCGVSDLGEVTGFPNLAWIEDPALDTKVGTTGGPKDGAPIAYDEGGELGSEPLPPVLDVCATQRRVFVIDAEDRLSVWFSKPFVKGYAPEFNASLRIRCAADGGDLVAIETLDDKLVMFKERSIHVTPIFSGPDANGDGTAFQPPREVASDTGCVNANSVASGPWGLVFQSERGLYVLDRGLALTWIGEPVKDSLGDATILAATVVPEATEVRFLLDTGAALVWDYRVNSWSTWDNAAGLHATTWQGKWARLLEDGTVEYEATHYDTPDTDNRPLLSITTAWIKLAHGLQGYQRIWTASILGDYYSGDLSIDVGYDYESEWTDTHDFREEDLLSFDRMQLKIKPTRQKSMAIRFRVRERVLSGATATVGRGFVLQSLQLEVGIKKGSYKMILPVQRRGAPDWLELTGVPKIELTDTETPLETPR